MSVKKGKKTRGGIAGSLAEINLPNVDKIEADKKTQSGAVDLLKEKILEKFIGEWTYAGASGNWREYEKQFGHGFLYWLCISSIGRLFLLFFLSISF